MRFRKKPVVIDAWEWDQTQKTLDVLKVVPGFMDQLMGFERNASGSIIHGMRLRTLEGPLTVSDGDWIIKGVKGEFYPCRPDIFRLIYEAEPGAVIDEPTRRESAK